MAETKIDLTELPEKPNTLRIFNRVGGTTLVPDTIYGAYGVSDGDKAEFEFTPADPVTRDLLKEVVMSLMVIQVEACKSNGVTQADISTDPVRPTSKSNTARKKYAQHLDNIGAALRMISTGSEYEKTKRETRELLATCVSISNFKEIDTNGDIVPSAKSSAEIMAVIPDIFVLWIFDEVQKISNLTTSEVLGL